MVTMEESNTTPGAITMKLFIETSKLDFVASFLMKRSDHQIVHQIDYGRLIRMGIKDGNKGWNQLGQKRRC